MSSNKQGASDKLRESQVDQCIAFLESLNENTNQIFEIPKDKRLALLIAAGKLSRPDKEELLKRKKGARKTVKKKLQLQDKAARAHTGIRSAREASVFVAPIMISLTGEGKAPIKLATPRECYVCKENYDTLHHFYDTMCQACGDFNYAKRFQTADMTDQVALVTGSRLKIGYHITLMMLRAGATVIATTRFPKDSALRFAQESDFNQWKDRLKIHGLDLRHIPSVEIFCNFIEQQYDRLDVLINNAAQTVRRPAGFYLHLMPNEKKPLGELPVHAQILLADHESCVQELKVLSADFEKGSNKNLPVSWHGKQLGIGLSASAELSQIPYSIDDSITAEEVFPEGKLDADLQQVDLRKTNSWRLKLGEVNTIEMLEVQLVNSVAPFVLNNRLVNLMKKENTGNKHIINVSAMEGKFHQFHKEARHPHTNMAKAALNMMTLTSAAELHKHGIYTNAVDTGWVTDEDPAELAKRKVDLHDFQPPLDIVDGAARVMDPLFDGINTGKHWNGKFLKDYKPTSW
ncbi:SDR family oxidoreductase [Reichenbachiella carrageenanivorans]|uniref:SDR family oxidoreductase n=1 Tax=Reichenbachiella carrageenanivorans TaxID=2979869 RepID=A0ABY6CXJ1_9BACT|nr:SDR family oxidoreductase [Reichenbachiella carrageenanivorans]UXX78642.1 SDR family oxidoreductase [Reichenbachiella carrageenanivorans]